jgi:hypothetical protein
MLRRMLLVCLVCCSLSWTNDVRAPAKSDSVRFAVIGDTGTGERPEFEVGAQLAKSRQTFPFDFVVMMGDNLYGGKKPKDFRDKLELPY